MEWWLILTIIFGSLMLLMLTGMPVAFCFMLINIIGVILWWGGVGGLQQIITNIYFSLADFALLPVPLFVLMGEVMFMSGIAPDMIDTLDQWLGRLPGRLSLEAVAAGTVLATLTGTSMSSAAVMTSTLLPEMEKRGYKLTMGLGPILGSGGLAVMIPPSAMAVFLAWVAKISIGRFLVAIIMPGLLLAALYAAYIIVRCWLQPSLAPAYTVPPIPLAKRLRGTARYILPIGLVIFLVTGVIFVGAATPSEAAATGALGMFLLAAIYGKFNWRMVKASISSSIATTTMLCIIIAAALVFSQLLAFTGASHGLATLATSLRISPLGIIIAMQVVLAILGCFMGQYPIIMITAPIFYPIVQALGFNSLWFSVIFLINMEMAGITPPFGLTLFTVKGIIGSKHTMREIIEAAVPFIYCNLAAIALIFVFPSIALWLPSVMR